MSWMHAVLLSIRPVYLSVGCELDPFLDGPAVDDPFPNEHTKEEQEFEDALQRYRDGLRFLN